MAGRKKKAKSGGKRVGMVARKAKPRAARKTRGRTGRRARYAKK